MIGPWDFLAVVVVASVTSHLVTTWIHAWRDVRLARARPPESLSSIRKDLH